MSKKPCNDNNYLPVKATLNRFVFRMDLAIFKRQRISICRQPIPQSGGCHTKRTITI